MSRFWMTAAAGVGGGYTASLVSMSYVYFPSSGIQTTFSQNKTNQTTAYGAFWLLADGQVGAGQYGGPVTHNGYDPCWLDPHSDAIADNYYVRWMIVSGYTVPLYFTSPSYPGSVGTWSSAIALTADRKWQCESRNQGYTDTYLRIQINDSTSFTSPEVDSYIQIWARST